MNDGNWQIFNDQDDIEHIPEPSCWCGPYLYFTSPDGVQIWIHRRLDPLDPGPPPEVLEEVFNECMEIE